MKAGYLECERRYTFWLLIFVAGWYGAYTFFLRGGVFCNAQTANVVLFAMALGKQEWLSAAYLLLPISAYFFGSFLSEWMGKTIKRMHFLRWDTLLIALEMCAVVFLAFMPAAWPDQICQVTLNFVCAMQFNTYRQVEGVPAATTFVTNHIRQIGSNLAKLIRHPEDHGLRRKMKVHASLLLCFMAGAVVSTMLCFMAGAVVSTMLCEACSYSSLLGALIPLGCTFVRLVHADLVLERGQLDVVPHGH
ncbi:MAG: DUF1275 domain-containing protein [Atopobiaceae bacterium]|nr:DUF1275 domain-containing protein [Atopobiaceae bacterium]